MPHGPLVNYEINYVNTSYFEKLSYSMIRFMSVTHSLTHSVTFISEENWSKEAYN